MIDSKNCIECLKTFNKNPKESWPQWERKKVCSVGCRGKHLAKLPGRIKKLREQKMGEKNPQWKGGLPKCLVCQKVVSYGGKHCKVHQPPNNWKGDKASYHAMHAWVARHRGKPQKCEHCGTTEKRMYHWANKSRRYKRDLTDWIRLCRPCHSKYDKLPL